ncbi:nucleotidyltransferase family protein, partial [Verrucomicrobiota bacterium]
MNRLEGFLFLCRCLAESTDSEPPGCCLADEITRGRIDWETVVDVASRHGITVTLYCALRNKGLLDVLPPDLLPYLEAVHELNGDRNRRLIDQAFEVAAILNRAGVEPILLKGPGNLLSGLYDDPGLRIAGDLDVLVPEARATECFEAMTAAGYRLVDEAARQEDVTASRGRHLPQLMSRGRVAFVELHRRAPQPEGRRLLDTEDLYDHSTVVTRPGASIRIPSASFRAMVAIAHAPLGLFTGLSSVMPLRDLYDVCLLGRRRDDPPDWSMIVDRFDRAGCGGWLRTCLMLVERLLGLPRPDGVGLPRAAWLRRQGCLLPVRCPRVLLVARVAAVVGTVLTRTEVGRLRRRNLARPDWYRRHMINVAR